jgi:uncharacterized protein
MNETLINKIKTLKEKYEKEGFVILGVFGSYARGEEVEHSDIDMLFEIKDSFYNKFKGWDIYPVIEKIEKNIEQELNHKIDMTNKNALNEIGKKYILPEVVYV